MPTVSVIIPTYNRGKKVIRAISSVLEQTYFDFEIIVIDDGSTDDTQSVVNQLKGPIKFISHKHNLGVSAARNSGIKISEAPFIAFLDSDDYWLPKKLKVQTEFFETHKNAVACQAEEIWIRKGRRVNPRKIHLKPSGEIFEPSLKLCLVSPSAVMLRRSLFDEIGLFDESLPACEDYDLWLRIACLYPVYLIKQYLLIKEGGHSDQLSTRYKGMDRFRIKALVKLIKSKKINNKQIISAAKELSLKCNIYGNGCIKRGKREEGKRYLQLAEKIQNETDL